MGSSLVLMYVGAFHKLGSGMWVRLMLLCSLHYVGTIDAAAPSMVKPSESYVGYRASTGLGVILSAPHGGLLEPSGIPERDAGCWDNVAERCVWSHSCGDKNFTKCRAVTVNDYYTQDLTQELYDSLCRLFHGACPAAVMNLLSRTFFDANRELEEGTFQVPAVVEAYDRYHMLIDAEEKKMRGIGLFIDIHGHGHPVQRAELGYLVAGNALDSGNPIDPGKTSIRSLAHRSGVDFDELLRGADSFGGFLGLYGFDSVPSPKHRGPGSLPYFNGGPNTRRHGSFYNGSFDAIQIESARTPRDPGMRPMYVKALACTIKSYYCKYYQHAINQTQGTVSADACAAGHTDTECSNRARQLSDLTGVCFATLVFLLFMQ